MYWICFTSGIWNDCWLTFRGLFHWMLIYWVITTSTWYTLLMFYNMRMCKVKNETCMAFQWSWILMNMVKVLWPVQFSYGRECRLNAEYIYSSQHLIFLGFRLAWSFKTKHLLFKRKSNGHVFYSRKQVMSLLNV